MSVPLHEVSERRQAVNVWTGIVEDIANKAGWRDARTLAGVGRVTDDLDDMTAELFDNKWDALIIALDIKNGRS